MDLCGHQALFAVAEADKNHLAGAELRQAEAAQRLHVHEDIFGALAARQEAEALGAVEPLTSARSRPLVAVTCTWVRTGGSCEG